MNGSADVEAPVPQQTEAASSPLPDDDALATLEEQKQHIFGTRLKPRRQVFFNKEANGYVTKYSRTHRKNRYAEFSPHEKHKHPIFIPKWPSILKFDFRNISWHVAMYFTLGSVAWIVNGQYAMWPLLNTQKTTNLMGYSALVGGLLFWVGAYLSIVEALNEQEKLNYGVELRHVMDALENEPRDIQRYVKNKISGANNNNQIAYHVVYVDKVKDNNNNNTSEKEGKKPPRKWRWIGTEPSSLGWWASVIQFTGATAFTISVITGTPNVISESQWQVTYALSWTMQVIGSIGFIVSSAMLMLEEQREWYIPAIDRIGWHSAFWNLIGSLGFFFSAVFGYLSNWNGNGVVCCQFWGTAFNTYYGSWAFLISSVLLLIEVENKEPTQFDHLVARASAWVAEKTRCDSEELEVERRKENSKENSNGAGGEDPPVQMGDRKVCY